MNWTAALLPEPPLSGSLPEQHFDCGSPGLSWLWVLFTDPTGEGRWAGCFRREQWGRDAIHLVPAVNDALIVAGGQGYWVSLVEKAVRFRASPIVVAATVPNRAMVVAADYTSVSLLLPEGVAWRSRRLSLDGISFSRVTFGTVTGEAEAPSGAVAFEIDLESRVASGGLQWD